MKLTNQQTIITLVTKETGYSKELVEVVYSNFYKTLRYYLTNRVADVIKLEKFLKFKDNEKEQHARWSSSRGSS
jgi:nucleoid DNA-binding protein